MNYDTLPSGDPTPAHIWEMQFHESGRVRRGHFPVESLKARVKQLTLLAKDMSVGKALKKSINRELVWRVHQLNKALGIKEETGG